MRWMAVHRAAGLIWRLMECDPHPAVLPMRVQKAPFQSCGEQSSLLPRALPQEMGVDGEVLERFVQRAMADKEENLHSMTVLRHGKVIGEYSFTPYDRTVWHATHSLCKTVTALGIGILLWEGKLCLSERVVDLFPDRCTPAARRYDNLTVFHLLTMTSGAAFAEPQSVTETDWVRGFLESPQLFPVGERFHYNSMNTYMLAAIICRKTGRTLRAFLQEKLFDAMGIRQFCWETCPMRIEKGGWGMFLLQEDAAKIGQLILNGGIWNGERLVPEAYIRDMCAWHSDPPAALGRHGYGYQCWPWEREGSVRLSGLFGQNVLVVPDVDMVIATNAGAGRMMGESRFMQVCSDFLREVEGGCVKPIYYTGENDDFTERVCVKTLPIGVLRREGTYRVRTGFARLLPVFMQLLENVYTTGIEEITFLRKGATLYIKVAEGETKNVLAVGFAAPLRGEITVNGEVHTVSVGGRWGNERGNPLLHVEIAFLEQASTRCMDFVFTGATLRVRLSERPGKEALLTGAGLLFGETAGRNPFENRFFRARLMALAEPELIAVRKK